MDSRSTGTVLRCLGAFVVFLSMATFGAEAPDYAAVDALFAKHCLDCHNATDAEKGLVLESFALLTKGGESGPAIEPGNSSDSRLVKFLEGRSGKKGKNQFMPPGKAKKLEPAEIAVIRAWIDAGARPPQNAMPLVRELNVPKITPKVPPRRSVNALASAQKAKLLAVARYGEVELFSTETRRLVRTLSGHRGSVNALAFSRDGRQLFAAGGLAGVFGEVREWDSSDGKLVRVLEAHRDAIYALALAPDGKTLATGSYDQKIKLWEVATGKEIKTLTGHNGAIFGLAFRPDGKVLASASADRTVKLWGVATGQRRDTLTQSLKEVYTVAFSPDGSQLVAAGVDNRIRVWAISPNAAEGTNPILHSRFAHEGTVLKVIFSPDGRTLVSSADDHTVKLWDAAELKERLLLEKQPDWAPALGFAPDGRSVVVGRLDGTLGFYDAVTGQLVSPAARELSQAKP